MFPAVKGHRADINQLLAALGISGTTLIGLFSLLWSQESAETGVQ